MQVKLYTTCVATIIIYYQARAQTFWGAGAQTKKKDTQCQKKISDRVEA